MMKATHGKTWVMLIGLLLLGAPPPQIGAGERADDAARPSLSEPNHLWNRIRYRLHVRVESEMAAGAELKPTRVTESLQIRVLLDAARVESSAQTFIEYRLRRRDQSQGKGAGFSAVTGEERERSDMLDLGPRNDEEKHLPILGFCRNCHLNQGILSMNSYTGSMDNVSRLRGIRTLADSSLKDQEDATIAWKQRQFSWGLLKGLMQNKSTQ